MPGVHEGAEHFGFHLGDFGLLFLFFLRQGLVTQPRLV